MMGVWPLYSLEALWPYVFLALASTVGLCPLVLANNHSKNVSSASINHSEEVLLGCLALLSPALFGEDSRCFIKDS